MQEDVGVGGCSEFTGGVGEELGGGGCQRNEVQSDRASWYIMFCFSVRYIVWVFKKRMQTGQVWVGTHLRFRGDSGKRPSRLPAAPEPAEHEPHFTSACSKPASTWLTQRVASTSSLTFQST